MNSIFSWLECDEHSFTRCSTIGSIAKRLAYMLELVYDHLNIICISTIILKPEERSLHFIKILLLKFKLQVYSPSIQNWSKFVKFFCEIVSHSFIFEFSHNL